MGTFEPFDEGYSGIVLLEPDTAYVYKSKKYYKVTMAEGQIVFTEKEYADLLEYLKNFDCIKLLNTGADITKNIAESLQQKEQ